MTSIIKAEYIAFRHVTWKNMWIHKFINKFHLVKPIQACILYKNNETSVTLTKNVKN